MSEKETLLYGRPMSPEERSQYLSAPQLGPYERIFASLHADLIPYYRSWTHDSPMLVSTKRDAELRKLHEILYRCCCYYVRHYKEYLDQIPYDKKILNLLTYVEDREFHAGTYRPDYLICEDGSLRLCEITSRFFGNGYFLSYFTEHAGKVFAKEAGISEPTSYYEEFLAYMAKLPGDKKKLAVLKSADRSDSIRLYVPFYHALGMETVIYEAEEVEKNLKDLKGAFIVSALNQKDLLSFSMDTLYRLADLDIHNDFRTIFLLHDKRFFALFYDDSFTKKCLTEEETVFLRDHAVPTYLPGSDRDVWEHARKHQNGYILKHRCLGKSEAVYAGVLTDPIVWEKLFISGTIRDMILQPFMKQKIFSTAWEQMQLDDYVCGTILTVDDRYFGTGLFRSSTRPVINQTDAHKVAQLITDQSGCFPNAHIL
ncbi:MAG: hypothetical protein IJW67_02955 [Blautia sp.]|nr:hypothetical protein [Blautia sp.]